jgi:hypothetical protein
LNRKLAALLPDDFNSTNDENDSFDNRSDDKGPEPEGVAIGRVGSRIYAFIGLERVGGIMMYDITDPDENDSFDNRSDDKGPEPEGVAIGRVGSRIYAFIGLERVGGIMMYDITDPDNPQFVNYVNNRDFSGDAEAGTAGDLGPEGVLFIDQDQSPTGQNLLVVTNEISGTTTVSIELLRNNGENR